MGTGKAMLNIRALMDPKLMKLVTAAPKVAADKISKIAGKSFSITGTLSKTRKQFIHDIQKAKAVYHNRIKKDTNYLIAGKDPGTAKIDLARTYNTTIISESIFKDLVNEDQKSSGIVIPGHKFTISGKLNRLTHQALADQIIRQGGAVVAYVRKDVDYVIQANNERYESTIIQQAKYYMTKIISETEILQAIKENNA